jgi:hypothetical protein
MKRTKVLVTPKVVGVMKRPKSTTVLVKPKMVGVRKKTLSGNNYAAKYTQ